MPEGAWWVWASIRNLETKGMLVWDDAGKTGRNNTMQDLMVQANNSGLFTESHVKLA